MPPSQQVTLGDGSTAHVASDGSITSAVGGVSFQEPDGNGGWITYDTTPDRQAQHVVAVQAFKTSRQYRQAVRRLRAPIRTRATGQARQRGAGRPRAQAARSSARSGDSGDEDGLDEPAPGWRGAHPAWRRSV